MNADNVTHGVFREVEEAIIVTSDTKSEKRSSPCMSAFIRVHPRLNILRTMTHTRLPIEIVFSVAFVCWSHVACGAEPTGLPARVKIAAVQMRGYDKGDLPRPGFDPSGTVIKYIERAGRDHARLVVFPEYILGRITVPGPVTERLGKAANANHLYVIVGCWEVREDGSFANAALLFNPAGELQGRYYKTHAAVDHYEGEPPWSRPPEGKSRNWFLRNDPEWIMERGHDLPVFELGFGTIGILTCYDGWFSEPFRVLSLKGAELIVWINGRRGSVEDFIVKAEMFRNEVAMVCANQAYGGGTMIGQWPAQILAASREKQESYIVATVDLARVRQTRAHSRNRTQRRPDLYGPICTPLPVSGKPIQ